MGLRDSGRRGGRPAPATALPEAARRGAPPAAPRGAVYCNGPAPAPREVAGTGRDAVRL